MSAPPPPPARPGVDGLEEALRIERSYKEMVASPSHSPTEAGARHFLTGPAPPHIGLGMASDQAESKTDVHAAAAGTGLHRVLVAGVDRRLEHVRRMRIELDEAWASLLSTYDREHVECWERAREVQGEYSSACALLGYELRRLELSSDLGRETALSPKYAVDPHPYDIDPPSSSSSSSDDSDADDDTNEGCHV